MTDTKQQRANYLLGRYAAAPLRVVSWGIAEDVLTVQAIIGDTTTTSRYLWNDTRQDWETPMTADQCPA